MHCTGYWEIVCPDGRLRHYPYHNRGDAEADARALSDPKRFAARGCRLGPGSSARERSQPPCPGGLHVVRPVAQGRHADATKKEYVAVAGIVSTVRDPAERSRLARRFASHFASERGEFDEGRFMAAVGGRAGRSRAHADFRREVGRIELQRKSETVVRCLVRYHGISEPLAEELVARHIERVADQLASGIRPAAIANTLAQFAT